MLYNYGRIFFKLSFFVGYILSFGLVRFRTVRLGGRVGAYINAGVHARACRGCDNQKCHNKNPGEEI